MTEEMNICIMVSANGEPKVYPRFERDTGTWLDYNMMCRPGQALYINGVYQDPTEYKDTNYKHSFAEEKQQQINEMTEEAKRRLRENPIPVDWHLNESRYYPPGENFKSTGSYALDSIADHKSGPYKF